MPHAVVTCDPRFTGELGTLGRWFAARGFTVALVSRLEPLAEDVADGADLLVMLGSPWSLARPMDGPEDDARAPRSIETERALTRRRIAEDRPLLGLCYGGQMVCSALGGEVEALGSGMVMRWDQPATDLGAMAASWLFMHEDHVRLPDGVEVLAVADHAAAAFRRGRAWGLQFHPEADSDLLRLWLEAYRPGQVPDGADEALRRADADPSGVDAAAFRLFDHIWSSASSA